MALTEQRRGEISLLVLKLKLKQEGLHLFAEVRQELQDDAMAMGVSPGELEEFFIDLLSGFIAEALGYKNVTIQIGPRLEEPKGYVQA